MAPIHYGDAYSNTSMEQYIHKLAKNIYINVYTDLQHIEHNKESTYTTARAKCIPHSYSHKYSWDLSTQNITEFATHCFIALIKVSKCLSVWFHMCPDIAEILLWLNILCENLFYRIRRGEFLLSPNTYTLVIPLGFFYSAEFPTAKYILQIKRDYIHKPWCNTHSNINSLRHSGVIWRHRSGSTLAQEMVCCLTAPNHYLKQCWRIINKV